MVLGVGTPETCEGWIFGSTQTTNKSLEVLFETNDQPIEMKDQSTCTMFCPTHDLTWTPERCKEVSHTVGRVWGACWDAGFFCIFTFLANASWFADVWQRDDALGARWGCSSFSGQHAMRGGQTYFSQRTLLHCPSWMSSWRFLKPASLVLCFSGKCFLTALQSACGSSVGYLESALPQYLALLSCFKMYPSKRTWKLPAVAGTQIIQNPVDQRQKHIPPNSVVTLGVLTVMVKSRGG